jgi:hypothetical protein
MKQFDYLNSKVWLLVRAVTNSASEGYGKNNNRSSKHLTRTNEPEANK